MYQAVQLCAPKPVLSMYPAPIVGVPAGTLAQQQAAHQAARQANGLSPDMGPGHQATVPVPLDSKTATTVGVAIGKTGGNRESAAAAEAATLDSRSAAAPPLKPKQLPVIRICTGDFSGGPNKGVFRLAGRALLPHGCAVRVPFAAGGSTEAWYICLAPTVRHIMLHWCSSVYEHAKTRCVAAYPCNMAYSAEKLKTSAHP
jgi:hypothetical protein